MKRPQPAGIVSIASSGVRIEGALEWPTQTPQGIVLFSHGTGSGRLSPRNNFVAAQLRRAGFATLLLDLLTPEEDRNFAHRFEIGRLTTRLIDAAAFLNGEPATRHLPLGTFGASTGAAAALRMAAALPEKIGAVVSRGGRPDLAGSPALARIRAPTLLLVGGMDTQVVGINRSALREIASPKEMHIVAGATHSFEEPGALEHVAELAGAWFNRHLHAADR